jgi:hypothetical protein
MTQAEGSFKRIKNNMNKAAIFPKLMLLREGTSIPLKKRDNDL